MACAVKKRSTALGVLPLDILAQLFGFLDFLDLIRRARPQNFVCAPGNCQHNAQQSANEDLLIAAVSAPLNRSIICHGAAPVYRACHLPAQVSTWRSIGSLQRNCEICRRPESVLRGQNGGAFKSKM